MPEKCQYCNQLITSFIIERFNALGEQVIASGDDKTWESEDSICPNCLKIVRTILNSS